jgi:serine/threonine protein phosphatase PrpC
MSLHLRFADYTASGPRPENQDATRLVTPAPSLAASKGYLFALADGVSQCADGALAARSTLQALALDYYSTPETWGIAQSLDRLLLAQNRWLLANGLLTTLSVLVLRGRRFTLAHVGDCRAYCWHGGVLTRISEDHVWDQPDMQHVLKRALGLDQHLVMDYLDGELREGERLLLLSDGVWAALGDAGVASILAEQTAPDDTVRTLVQTAHLAGSQDNASALLIQIDALGADDLGDALARLQQWPVPPALKPEQTFEGWTIQQVLAQSRQSCLYRVRDSQNQPWLLKTLPASRLDDSAAAQSLMLEEWFLRRVAGRFFPELHPLPEREHLYYVMREHPGRTLAERFADQGPLPLPQWRELAGRLLKGAGLLHRRNIVHRDLKPENLLLDDQGDLRILDFGLAFCPGLSANTPDQLPGTPSYIAPESFSGASPAPQQDLYAIGVTLYYLLTGQYPYGEVEAFQRPRFGSPVPASRYRPDVPDWLDLTLSTALDPDPARRYETAEQWLLELEQAEHRPASARPRPLLEREPLKVWRTVALASLCCNLAALLVWLARH